MATSTFDPDTPTRNGTEPKLRFDSIADCIKAFAAGEFLIVLDSPSRENEGDLIVAAHALTTAKAAFMIRYTSGYLCAPLPRALAARLALPPMLPSSGLNEDPKGTAYTIPVDAAASAGHPISTGISAHDRAVTARLLARPDATAADFRRPGHVVPLLVRDGGVRVRGGHTEAGWEFCRLAGIAPAVCVIGEMVVDGREGAAGRPELAASGMMRRNECLAFGRAWGIKCCTIEDLIQYVVERDGPLVGGGAGTVNGHDGEGGGGEKL